MRDLLILMPPFPGRTFPILGRRARGNARICNHLRSGMAFADDNGLIIRYFDFMRTGEPAPRILIADDQPDVLEALRLLLKGEGFKTETVQSPAAVLETVKQRDFEALLMDLNYARDTTSGQEGLDLLAKVQSLDATLPVVVMTAWSSVELAVEAMRRGARDFIKKPWENERVVAILKTQISLARALRAQQRLEAENRSLKPQSGPLLIANAPSMRPVV